MENLFRTHLIWTLCIWGLLNSSGSAASANPQAYQIVPETSFITASTERSGLLGFLGHTHAILAKNWTADLCLDPANVKNSYTHIEIPVEFLELDTPEARTKAGLDSQGPSAEDQKKIMEKMLGPEYLDKNQYPNITFDSQAVEDEGSNRIRLQGLLKIRGQSRPISVLVKSKVENDSSASFSGDVKIKQTDFGITPQSVAGVVNVANEVQLRFWITARPTQQNCRARP